MTNGFAERRKYQAASRSTLPTRSTF